MPQKFFPEQIELLLKRLGIVLALYTVMRAFFFYFNSAAFQFTESNEIIYAFLFGIRFDAAAVFLINTPFIILSLAPIKIQSKSTI